RRQRTGFELLTQGLAFEKLADQIGRGLIRCDLVLSDVVDSENVGMVERRDRARFLLKTAQAVGVFGQSLGQNLDGDVAAESGVARAVHFAHPARSERRNNFVRTELRARGQSHAWGEL